MKNTPINVVLDFIHNEVPDNIKVIRNLFNTDHEYTTLLMNDDGEQYEIIHSFNTPFIPTDHHAVIINKQGVDHFTWNDGYVSEATDRFHTLMVMINELIVDHPAVIRAGLTSNVTEITDKIYNCYNTVSQLDDDGNMYISRDSLPDDYTEMMIKETHHNHKIVKTNNVLRWEGGKTVKDLLKHVSLNDIIVSYHNEGITKNSDEYRELYRNMGCSLSCYWEVFYWDLNNPECNKYKQPATEN